MFVLRLLAPLLLALGAYWLLIRIQRRYQLSRTQFRWLLAGTALLVFVLVLIVMGRLPPQTLFAPLLFLLTFALRNAHWVMQILSMLRSRRANAGAPGGGKRDAGVSTVSTAWLTMELSHATGAMDGRVLQGEFEGCQLSALTQPQLLLLAQSCQHDGESLQLLEAYLDRMHPDWRDAFESDSSAGAADSTGDEGAMTAALAYEILGLSDGASADEIIAAHRRLMQKLHPDRGGSDYLAQRINAARDFLLGQ